MFGCWIPHLWTFELFNDLQFYKYVKVERFLNKYSNYFELNKNKGIAFNLIYRLINANKYRD